MDTDPKPRLSKLAVLSLAIPSLLAVSPYIILLLLTCIFGHFPSDRVNAVLDKIGEQFRLSVSYGSAETIHSIFIIISSASLAIPAIFQIHRSHGALRGYLWPIVSLILIPIFVFDNVFLWIILFDHMAW